MLSSALALDNSRYVASKLPNISAKLNHRDAFAIVSGARRGAPVIGRIGRHCLRCPCLLKALDGMSGFCH